MIPNSAWSTESLRACLFDFGGTLDSDGETWQDSFYRLYQIHGLNPDREAFRLAFYRADDTLAETRYLVGQGFRKTVETQAEIVWEALRMRDPRARLQAIVEGFLEGSLRSIERNRDLLSSLESRYRLGIVSNFYGNLENVCDDLGIRGFFRCVVDSTQEGVVKPDPRIFRAALGRIGVEAGQAVFVGDNVYRDMEGARNTGMRHVLLAGNLSPERKSCCPGDPVIRSLEELGPLLLNGRQHDKGDNP